MANDFRGADGLTEDLPLLAAVSYETGFPIDEFLAAVASTLRTENFRLGGAIQQNTVQPDPAGKLACCSDMALVDLASGERIVISQDLGSDAGACRLDSGSLVEMGGRLEFNVNESIDLLILNKFGKAEADGGGFRSVIARAMDVSVPLLTAVRPLHREAWQRFHGGLAVELPAEPESILAWCRRAADAGRRARSMRPVERSA